MESLNILFTSVGRRVSLVRHFQKLIKELRLEGMVAGVDVSADAPAFHVVDCALTICRIDDPDYIPQLLHICKVNNINLLFPLIDTDLLLLAENKEAFQAIGTTVVVSAPRLIRIAMNKFKTHDFFTEKGVDVPVLYELETVLDGTGEFPFFMKPLDGSASQGIVKIRNQKELLFFKDYINKPILLEYIHGAEFTLDMLFDFTGKVRCIVPRRRIEVRAGEVSKAVIDDNEYVMRAGWQVAEQLHGDAIGCINVQCFLTEDNRVTFIEINPRFGGGVPLSLHAGADFPRWIIEMVLGKDPDDIKYAYNNNMAMLRYDDAVFVDNWQD